jgi:uncharacterized protein YjiK
MSVLGVVGALVLSLSAWLLPPGQTEPVLAGYDLSSDAGTQVQVPGVLQEISGLATSSDGRLFAHNDEHATVYELEPGTGTVKKAFSVGMGGSAGDFEGLAIAEERFFLITSASTLLEFREGDADSPVPYRIHRLGLGSRCETEGLAFDEVSRSLLVPCKTVSARELRNHLVVYSVPLDSMRPDARPRIFLPLATLDEAGLGDEFHPSAVEVHPESGSLILLAAREEALVELSPGGEVLFTKEFKRKEHPQPEGLAFLPNGSLIVADEGQGARGTLTRYDRKSDESGRDR